MTAAVRSMSNADGERRPPRMEGVRRKPVPVTNRSFSSTQSSRRGSEQSAQSGRGSTSEESRRPPYPLKEPFMHVAVVPRAAIGAVRPVTPEMSGRRSPSQLHSRQESLRNHTRQDSDSYRRPTYLNTHRPSTSSDSDRAPLMFGHARSFSGQGGSTSSATSTYSTDNKQQASPAQRISLQQSSSYRAPHNPTPPIGARNPARGAPPSSFPRAAYFQHPGPPALSDIHPALRTPPLSHSATPTPINGSTQTTPSSSQDNAVYLSTNDETFYDNSENLKSHFSDDSDSDAEHSKAERKAKMFKRMRKPGQTFNKEKEKSGGKAMVITKPLASPAAVSPSQQVIPPRSGPPPNTPLPAIPTTRPGAGARRASANDSPLLSVPKTRADHSGSPRPFTPPTASKVSLAHSPLPRSASGSPALSQRRGDKALPPVPTFGNGQPLNVDQLDAALLRQAERLRALKALEPKISNPDTASLDSHSGYDVRKGGVSPAVWSEAFERPAAPAPVREASPRRGVTAEEKEMGVGLKSPLREAFGTTPIAVMLQAPRAEERVHSPLPSPAPMTALPRLPTAVRKAPPPPVRIDTPQNYKSSNTPQLRSATPTSASRTATPRAGGRRTPQQTPTSARHGQGIRKQPSNTQLRTRTVPRTNTPSRVASPAHTHTTTRTRSRSRTRAKVSTRAELPLPPSPGFRKPGVGIGMPETTPSLTKLNEQRERDVEKRRSRTNMKPQGPRAAPIVRTEQEMRFRAGERAVFVPPPHQQQLSKGFNERHGERYNEEKYAGGRRDLGGNVRVEAPVVRRDPRLLLEKPTKESEKRWEEKYNEKAKKPMGESWFKAIFCVR